MLLKVLSLCLLAAAVNAQVPSFGSCPNIQLKPTLNLTRYLGDWYEQEHFFAIFQMGQDCVKATYTLKDNGHIKVANRGRDTKTGEVKEAIGDAIVPDPKFPSKLGVKFSEFQPYGDYWVVDTDYENYSVVYSCADYLGGLFKTEFAWILARKPVLEDSTVQRLQKILSDGGVDPSRFSVTNQKDCPPL